jgi:hypothetical protein
MAAPVYHIVFHQGCWRIEYQGLYWGEFATAAEASETALKIAKCRLVPHGRSFHLVLMFCGQEPIAEQRESARATKRQVKQSYVADRVRYAADEPRAVP